MTAFTAFAFPATGGTHSTTMPDRLANVINVKDDFNAKGDGVTDDRAAIQAAFDAAFGSAASPHGSTNRFLNRPVYFPSGNYAVAGPLYLTHVVGGMIYGAGQASTQLIFTGSLGGNTVVANGSTPIIMTNGVSFSTIRDMSFAISGVSSVGIYLYQDGTQGGTNGNNFTNLLVSNAEQGFLIGYQANALCSEMTFLNCNTQNCSFAGFRNILQNALDNAFINCAAADCARGFSIPTGGAHIYCASLAGNGLDIEMGVDPMTIVGCRTESANFVKATDTCIVHISGCLYTGGAGAGYFVDAGSASRVIMDACVQSGATATEGLISGSSGSKVYLRGCTFANTHYLDAYTGTVVQNI